MDRPQRASVAEETARLGRLQHTSYVRFHSLFCEECSHPLPPLRLADDGSNSKTPADRERQSDRQTDRQANAMFTEWAYVYVYLLSYEAIFDAMNAVRRRGATSVLHPLLNSNRQFVVLGV
eukprot:GHVU01106754.1.p3 GENE.GHVU01106754.1~~GHVU01106754.1.p3  ORF type:complete len:121 (-),score=9.56 GHVU01106754.1:581-943(-)